MSEKLSVKLGDVLSPPPRRGKAVAVKNEDGASFHDHLRPRIDWQHERGRCLRIPGMAVDDAPAVTSGAMAAQVQKDAAFACPDHSLLSSNEGSGADADNLTVALEMQGSPSEWPVAAPRRPQSQIDEGLQGGWNGHHLDQVRTNEVAEARDEVSGVPSAEPQPSTSLHVLPERGASIAMATNAETCTNHIVMGSGNSPKPQQWLGREADDLPLIPRVVRTEPGQGRAALVPQSEVSVLPGSADIQERLGQRVGSVAQSVTSHAEMQTAPPEGTSPASAPLLAPANPVNGLQLHAAFIRSVDVLPASEGRESQGEFLFDGMFQINVAEGAYLRLRAPPGARQGAAIWAQVINAMHSAGGRSFQIQLAPVELGRVRITMTATDIGLQVAIIAERFETLELMRRFGPEFEKALSDIGYQQFNMTFSHQQGADRHSQEVVQDDSEGGVGGFEPVANAIMHLVDMPGAGGMDLRV